MDHRSRRNFIGARRKPTSRAHRDLLGAVGEQEDVRPVFALGMEAPTQEATPAWRRAF